MEDTDAFFTPEPTRLHLHARPAKPLRATGEEGTLTFPSGFTTPHPENNTVVRAVFSRQSDSEAATGQRRAARWWCSRSGTPMPTATSACARSCRSSASRRCASACPITMRAGRRSSRAPTTSSARTSSGRCRCAARRCWTSGRALWWLRDQGYERLGLLGTSLGSCLSMLTDVSRAAGARAGAQPRVAALRRRGVARPVHRARAAGARRSRRHRTTARPVAADQPVVVHRAPARQADAAGVREVRPHVPGRSVVG